MKNKIKRRSTRLAGLLLVITSPALQAGPSNYSPFPPGQHPPVCQIQTLDDEVPGADMTLLPAARVYRMQGYQLTISVENSLVSMSNPQGQTVLAPTEIPLTPLGFAGVETLDLNRDGHPDFVITSLSNGNGLAGGYAWRNVLLSSPGRGKTPSPLSYRVFEIETYEPTAQDYIAVGAAGTCLMMQVSPVYAQNHKEQRRRLYWVHNLLRFDRQGVQEANQQLSGFPQWIWYTDAPNYKASSRLSIADKKVALKEQQWGKIREYFPQ